MTIKIHKIEDLYVGEEFAHGKSTGKFAILRMMGFEGEHEDESVFRRIYEGWCDFIPLDPDRELGYYPADQLFINWSDFPEIHQVKLMAWDTDGEMVYGYTGTIATLLNRLKEA